MILKRLVGLSLIMFGTAVVLLLFVGLVLNPNPSLGLLSAPGAATGTGVAPTGSSALSGTASGGATSSGGVAVNNSGANPAGVQEGGTNTSPAGATTAGGSAGTVASPTKTPTSAGGGGSTATPSPGHTSTPTPAPTPAPTPPPAACGSAGGACTAAQVATHNSAGNCWVIYGGNYFIVTSFVSVHPGGTAVFNSTTCGHDITAYLNGSASTAGQRHTHSSSAYSILNSYKVGPVQG